MLEHRYELVCQFLLPAETVYHTVELRWLEQLWNHEKFELMSVNHRARPEGIIGISFPFS